MEIDALDDFDTQIQPAIDFPLTKWHGHHVQWLCQLRTQFYEIFRPLSPILSMKKWMNPFPHSNTSIKTQDFAGQSLNHKTPERNAWARSDALTRFYTTQKWVPNQVLANSAMSTITGRISLQELLSADYLNQEVQIVPFTLDWDANLPFIALPEGTSWADLQAPIAGVYQSYFPHGLDYLTLSPNWWNSSDLHAINQVNGYLQIFDSHYAEMLSAAQAKATESAIQSVQIAISAAIRSTEAATASSQTHNPYTAIDQAEIAQVSAKQAKDIALTAEQESVILEVFAQAKIQVAAAEKQKAIDVTTKAVLATSPPYLGRTGRSLTKHQKYVLQAWNEERLKTAAEAEIQTNRAAVAEQEAKIALAAAAGKKQAAANARAQAQIAEKSATEAGVFAEKFITTSPFFVDNPSIVPSYGLKDFLGREYLSPWLSPRPLSFQELDDRIEVDLDIAFYQLRAKTALALGQYSEAVQDLDKVIELNPSQPIFYLERGVAYFGMGEYDLSLADYHQFASQSPQATSFSSWNFSKGLTTGLINGGWNSIEGACEFLKEFSGSPIHTSQQIYNSFLTLINLVANDEWGVVAQVISPELCQLVKQWETLSDYQKGNLAGYALGKHGCDILVPGAIAKVASKSVKSAKELAAFCKEIQFAQETLILETAAGIGNGAKIAEVIEAGQQTALFAEELGVTASEVGQLKQAGKLEGAIANNLERISNTPALRESVDLFKKAEAFLKPYRKNFISEIEVRDLIHQTGIRTFPRPAGIPESYRIRVSDTGAGMLYVHPEHTHTYVRVMPGKPHSPFPCQHNPYVIQMKDGKALDKLGNFCAESDPIAHLPLDGFIYRN